HKPPWTGGNPGNRRALAISTAGLIEARGSYTLYCLGLVVAEDLPWLPDQLTSLPASAPDAFAAAVPALVPPPDVQTADLILGLTPDHLAYTATRGLREPVKLDSEIARLWQDQGSHKAKAEDLRAANRARNYTHLTAALRAVRDAPGSWWHVAWR